MAWKMTMNGWSYLQLGWNKSCIDVKVSEHCTIPWPWNSTVLTDLHIYTGFIPTQLMTNTSGCCYSLQCSWRWMQRASETL